MLIYGTAVRARGETKGAVLGALGVYFDWEAQGASIVRDEARLSAAEWARTTVMLLDGQRRIIASTHPEALFTPFDLRDGGAARGSYSDARGRTIAFARTLGFEEYDGRGWFGVVIQEN